MKKLALAVLVVLAAANISACNSTYEWVKNKLSDDPLLIGYQSVILKEGILPEATIKFDTNSVDLSDKDVETIAALINDDRYYIIEGTAGSTDKTAIRLATNRAFSVIKVLESQGIPPKKIYVSDYDPSKPGRRVHIYSIQF